jgi:hypothetical protein
MDAGESGASTNWIRAELNVVKKTTMRIPSRMEFSERTTNSAANSGRSIVPPFCPAILDPDVLTFKVAGLA